MKVTKICKPLSQYSNKTPEPLSVISTLIPLHILHPHEIGWFDFSLIMHKSLSSFKTRCFKYKEVDMLSEYGKEIKYNTLRSRSMQIIPLSEMPGRNINIRGVR